MSDVEDDERKIENDESKDKDPQIKTRHKQFLEERFSVIKPKSREGAPPGIASDPESTLPDSTVDENFRRNLIKDYRKSQKRKAEDE